MVGVLRVEGDPKLGPSVGLARQNSDIPTVMTSAADVHRSNQKLGHNVLHATESSSNLVSIPMEESVIIAHHRIAKV